MSEETLNTIESEHEINTQLHANSLIITKLPEKEF